MSRDEKESRGFNGCFRDFRSDRFYFYRGLDGGGETLYTLFILRLLLSLCRRLYWHQWLVQTLNTSKALSKAFQ
jgi:hypothetical protein